MFFIDTTNPIIILVSVVLTLALIYLGKEAKNSYLPLISLIAFLLVLVMHVVQYTILSNEYAVYAGIMGKCLGVDFIMVFVGYISYLWVDDIETKEKKKKSIDNSLEWFWKNVWPIGDGSFLDIFVKLNNKFKMLKDGL